MKIVHWWDRSNQMNSKYRHSIQKFLLHCHLIQFWHGIHQRKMCCCELKINCFQKKNILRIDFVPSSSWFFLLLSILWMVFSCLPLDLCFHRCVQQPLSLSAFSSSLPPPSSSLPPSDCLISVSNFPLFVSLSVYRERSVFCVSSLFSPFSSIIAFCYWRRSMHSS